MASAQVITGAIAFDNTTQPGATLTPGIIDPTVTDLNFENIQTNGGTGTYASIPSGYVGTIADPIVFGTIALTGTYPGYTGAALSLDTADGADLWSFTYAGTTYSFAATTYNVAPVGGSLWDIYGDGIASVSGYADAGGTYDISFSAQGVTSFESTTTVPDGAATSLLVGLGLLAIGGYAFCNRRAKA